MNQRLFARLCALTLFGLMAWVSYTQTPPAPAVPAPAVLKVNKLADDLFELENGGSGNVAVYVTGEGVILVDDKFDQDHDVVMEKIKTITDQPVKYIINTHYHSDHSGGNAKFLPMAEIISTANSRANIVGHKQSNEAPGMMPARIVFTDQTSVFLGGKEVRAKFFGRGHTNGDAFVYFPALKIVHTGDMVTSNSPLIDYNGGGSIVEWVKTLDAVMKDLDFDTVIPGHGPVTNRAGMMTYRNNAEALRSRVSSMIRSGKSQEEVAAMLTAEYKWPADGNNMKWALPGMMQEMR